MNKRFRSRGIRIIFDHGNIICREKLYYEPDDNCIHSNKDIRKLEKMKLLEMFEYSIINNEIDTYNYHVNLSEDNYKQIYINLPDLITEKFDIIISCFGSEMKNYTVGYRLKDNVIEQRSFYFYPTVWKNTRYGIKGIIDKKRINKGIDLFLKCLFGTDFFCCEELHDFKCMIYKFKGVSIHSINNTIGYKIYGRVNTSSLNHYLLKYYNYEIDDKYGECVLAAIRFCDNKIQGVNIYFLK